MGKNHGIALSLIFLTMAALFLAGEMNCNTCEEPNNANVHDHPILRSVVDEILDPLPEVEAAINFAIRKTKAAVETTTKEVKQDEKSEICEEMYDDAVSDLNESIVDLKRGNIGGLKANLCSAMTYYTGCDDAYDESGEVSPFATMNNALERLVRKCLALLSQLA